MSIICDSTLTAKGCGRMPLIVNEQGYYKRGGAQSAATAALWIVKQSANYTYASLANYLTFFVTKRSERLYSILQTHVQTFIL
jgi:hypothetical protein